MFQRVLVLSPHFDEAAFCCGGTIAELVLSGREVLCIGFSPCNESLPPSFPVDTLFDEARNAHRILGVQPENEHLYGFNVLSNFNVRTFPKHRQEILERLVKLAKRYQPDTVLAPSSQDVHQDHQVVYREALRAFRTATILGYECPWGNYEFWPGCFVSLTRDSLNTKLNAAAEFRSQAGRHATDQEFLVSLAKLRGGQIKLEYAEAFEVIRLVVRPQMTAGIET